MHSASTLGMAAAGLLTREVWVAFALCAPAVILGNMAGLKLYGLVGERQFRWIVLGLILVSGLSLAIR